LTGSAGITFGGNAATRFGAGAVIISFKHCSATCTIQCVAKHKLVTSMVAHTEFDENYSTMKTVFFIA